MKANNVSKVIGFDLHKVWSITSCFTDGRVVKRFRCGTDVSHYLMYVLNPLFAYVKRCL